MCICHGHTWYSTGNSHARSWYNAANSPTTYCTYGPKYISQKKIKVSSSLIAQADFGAPCRTPCSRCLGLFLFIYNPLGCVLAWILTLLHQAWTPPIRIRRCDGLICICTKNINVQPVEHRRLDSGLMHQDGMLTPIFFALLNMSDANVMSVFATQNGLHYKVPSWL